MAIGGGANMMTAISLAIQIGRREWKSYLISQAWTLALWYGFALGVFELHDVLRISWVGLGLQAVYLYRSITKSHLVTLLPITHHEAWLATSVLAAAVPAVIQVAVGLLMLAFVPDYGREVFGLAPTVTMVVIGGLYTAGFLQIALSLPAPAQRFPFLHTALVVILLVGLFVNAHVLPARLSEFTPLSTAVALAAAYLLVSRTFQEQLHPKRSIKRPSVQLATRPASRRNPAGRSVDWTSSNPRDTPRTRDGPLRCQRSRRRMARLVARGHNTGSCHAGRVGALCDKHRVDDAAW